MAQSLSPKHTRKIRRILLDLLDQSEADACLLCDQAGHILAEEGVEARDPQLMSALGAGVFAATRELAGLLGEDEFSSVVHQGTSKSILINAIDEDALLLVIFGHDANLGLVRLYTPAAATSIRTVLERARSGEDSMAAETTFVLRSNSSLFGASSAKPAMNPQEK